MKTINQYHIQVLMMMIEPLFALQQSQVRNVITRQKNKNKTVMTL